METKQRGRPKVIIGTLRVNSRITPTQQKFIKTMAKKEKMTEGEVHRAIINYYIETHF